MLWYPKSHTRILMVLPVINLSGTWGYNPLFLLTIMFSLVRTFIFSEQNFRPADSFHTKKLGSSHCQKSFKHTQVTVLTLFSQVKLMIECTRKMARHCRAWGALPQSLYRKWTSVIWLWLKINQLCNVTIIYIFQIVYMQKRTHLCSWDFFYDRNLFCGVAVIA